MLLKVRLDDCLVILALFSNGNEMAFILEEFQTCGSKGDQRPHHSDVRGMEVSTQQLGETLDPPIRDEDDFWITPEEVN